MGWLVGFWDGPHRWSIRNHFWSVIISFLIYQKLISEFSQQCFWNTINWNTAPTRRLITVVRNRSSEARFSQLDGPDGLETDQEPETAGRAAVQKCSVSSGTFCCCKGLPQSDCCWELCSCNIGIDQRDFQKKLHRQKLLSEKYPVYPSPDWRSAAPSLYPDFA